MQITTTATDKLLTEWAKAHILTNTEADYITPQAHQQSVGEVLAYSRMFYLAAGSNQARYRHDFYMPMLARAADIEEMYLLDVHQKHAKALLAAAGAAS